VAAGLQACLLLVLAAVPARAEIDFSGSWVSINQEDALERGAGPNPGDWAGLPFNESGRAKALAFNQSVISEPERICWFQTQWHIAAGPFSLRMWAVPDPVTGRVQAWMIGAWETRAPMIIWMDGRPHPSKYAEHTREGFTTGHWEGDTLVAFTTHMKAGFIRKNGPPSSDQATMTSRFFRHGDILTVLAVIEDPIYLAEPHIVTKSFELSATPMSPVGPPCVSAFEGKRPGDGVPHFLPEKNPFVDELTKLFHLPREAVLGGVETLYPEYRKKIKDTYVRLEPCKTNCGAPPPR
jgi:hypothetical protein